MNPSPDSAPLDEPMDHAYIDEADLRARYVLHRLAIEEERRFEAHLVGCAVCQEWVEHELAFRDGLRDVSRSLAAGSKWPTPATVRWWRTTPALAAAALLILCAGLIVQLRLTALQRDAVANDARRERSIAEHTAASLQARLTQAERRATEAGGPSADRGGPAVVFALTLTRAGLADDSAANRLSLGDATRVVLTVDLAMPAGSARFVATLVDTSRQTEIWKRGPFAAPAPETLTLALDAAILHPGDFVLRLERVSSDGRAAPERTYSFRVMAPGK